MFRLTIGTIASAVPPARPDSVIGTCNADPPASTGEATAEFPEARAIRQSSNMRHTATAAAPIPRRWFQRFSRSRRCLKSKAISLPKPIYPPMARQIRLQGTVTVQVLIDETGKSFQPRLSPVHPCSFPKRRRAAMQARFSPTMLERSAGEGVGSDHLQLRNEQ